MRFVEKVDGPYRVASVDGRLRIGRTTRDAKSGCALYKISWTASGGSVRGTVEAKENIDPIGSSMIIAFSWEELVKSFEALAKLDELDEIEEVIDQIEDVIDEVGLGVCELNRIRKGRFAEKLKTQFEVIIKLSDGSKQQYRNGLKVQLAQR